MLDDLFGVVEGIAGDAVGHEHDVIAVVQRFDDDARDPDVERHPRRDDGLDAERAERHVEIRAVEGRHAVGSDGVEIAGRRAELGDDVGRGLAEDQIVRILEHPVHERDVEEAPLAVASERGPAMHDRNARRGARPRRADRGVSVCPPPRRRPPARG